MNLFNKILDVTTNRSKDYQKELDAYDRILGEIQAIEDLLNCYTETDSLSSYPDLYQSKVIKLKSIKDAIFMYRKKIAAQVDKKEIEVIKKEILMLEVKYKVLLEKIKEELLSLGLITELNEHLSKLKTLIYKNARLETLKDFINKEIWKTEDLENLRNEISKRKIVIIPYLGRMK